MYRKDEPLHIAHPILEISSNIDVDRQIRFCDRIIAVKIAQAATVDLDNLYAIESERAIYEGIKENLKILEVLFKIKNENIIY